MGRAAFRSSRAVALIGITGLVGLAPVPAQAAGIAGGSVFQAKAEAYPFQMRTSNDTIPVTQGFEGYGPYARTNLDSLGASDAVASAPYPGEIATGGSGLAQSVTGVQLPDYPYFLLSAAGDDPKDKNFPGSSLHTESGSAASVARAVMGSNFSGGKASARSEVLANGDVQALAESSFDLLEIGGNLSISGLKTSARTVSSTGGKLTRFSLLEFNRLSFPGLRYETPCKVPPQIPAPGDLPCQSFAAPDFALRNGQFFATSPDGGNQEVPASPEAVIEAFKAAGVTMTYQAAQDTPTGILGAGITLDYEFPAAPSNPSGFEGPTRQVIKIGFSSASATQRPDAAAPVQTEPAEGGPIGVENAPAAAARPEPARRIP